MGKRNNVKGGNKRHHYDACWVVAIMIALVGVTGRVAGDCLLHLIARGGFGTCSSIVGSQFNSTDGTLTIPSNSRCQIGCSIAFPKNHLVNETICSSTGSQLIQMEECLTTDECLSGSYFIRQNAANKFVASISGTKNFGTSMSMSGDGKTVVVGASQADRSVWTYVRDPLTDGWVQQGPILIGTAGSDFGYSLALNYDGSTLAVGAPMIPIHSVPFTSLLGM